MKLGIVKTNIRKSILIRTSGRATRTLKKALILEDRKNGMGKKS